MNMVKDYVNIHLRLIQTDVLKFVIFLMNKIYGQSKTEDFNFNMSLL